MTTLLLVNIGNSDLLVDGRRMQRPRPDGQALWETFAQHQIEAPIIEPCLRELLRAVPRIDRVLLFVTDQPDTAETRVPDRFGVALRDKDTIWFGQIVARLLRERFGDALGEIALVTIARADGRAINPSMYDEAFEAYGELIARHYDPDVTACYALMAGGIPACNTALQLQAISAYGERCRTIYQPEGGAPYELRVGAQVLATFRRATLIDALGRRDFATALALAPRAAGDDLAGLIAYAHYRECFDFELAQQALADALRAASGEVRTFLGALRGELDDLRTREDIGALLRELMASAEITFGNGRYADFLGRVFRFQEAALRYIVEVKLGLPTDMRKERRAVNGPAFVQGIAATPALKAALDAVTIDGTPLRYDTPNLPTMHAMLDYILTPGTTRPDGAPCLSKAEAGRYGEVRRRLNRLTSLAQLRNQSVIAHGFAGVSRKRLEEAYGGDPSGLLADMRKVLELLGLPAGPSPLDRIADFVIAQLRRGAR
ncbi:MAG TPA: hypothetical protein VNL77_06975 [Roseiflexaceae bacterium]|nr:hypothetical protein [Roseiflexaceae bacterium]